jgi:hypothetical protein
MACTNKVAFASRNTQRTCTTLTLIRCYRIAGTKFPVTPRDAPIQPNAFTKEIITLAAGIKRHARQWILAFPANTVAFTTFTRLYKAWSTP